MEHRNRGAAVSLRADRPGPRASALTVQPSSPSQRAVLKAVQACGVTPSVPPAPAVLLNDQRNIDDG